MTEEEEKRDRESYEHYKLLDRITAARRKNLLDFMNASDARKAAIHHHRTVFPGLLDRVKAELGAEIEKAANKAKFAVVVAFDDLKVKVLADVEPIATMMRMEGYEVKILPGHNGKPGAMILEWSELRMMDKRPNLVTP